MNTCVTINNTYVLPPEIVCEILQRTTCHPFLLRVCQGFAANFFDAFFQGCSNHPSLKERVNRIDSMHDKASASQKAKAFYEYLIQDIKNTVPLSREGAFEKEELLKLGLSIEHLHRLENWLEDISLFRCFGVAAKEIPQAQTWLQSLKEKEISKKAAKIRLWLSSFKEDLKAILELNLINESIAVLPKEMALFTQLQTLYLGHNKLTTLPKEIGLLNQLKTLRINNNQLTSLPKEIGLLNQLQDLHLNNNQLTSLPKEMGHLKQLKTLNLCENQLSSLPEEICHLNQLQWFTLGKNQLSSLPKEMENLNQLKYLNLCDNPLIRTNLPEWLNKLIKAEIAFAHDSEEYHRLHADRYVSFVIR